MTDNLPEPPVKLSNEWSFFNSAWSRWLMCQCFPYGESKATEPSGKRCKSQSFPKADDDCISVIVLYSMYKNAYKFLIKCLWIWTNLNLIFESWHFYTARLLQVRVWLTVDHMMLLSECVTPPILELQYLHILLSLRSSCDVLHLEAHLRFTQSLFNSNDVSECFSMLSSFKCIFWDYKPVCLVILNPIFPTRFL